MHMIRRFKEFLIEFSKKEKLKSIFLETDGKSPFPPNTIAALKKQITTSAKDLTRKWESPIELLAFVFEKYDISVPAPHLSQRWDQYIDLLNYSIERLYQARGFD